MRPSDSELIEKAKRTGLPVVHIRPMMQVVDEVATVDLRGQVPVVSWRRSSPFNQSVTINTPQSSAGILGIGLF